MPNSSSGLAATTEPVPIPNSPANPAAITIFTTYLRFIIELVLAELNLGWARSARQAQ